MHPMVSNSTYEIMEEQFYKSLKHEWMQDHNMTAVEFDKDEDLQAFIHSKAAKDADEWIED